MEKKDYIGYLITLIVFAWLFMSWFQMAVTKDISNWNLFELIIKVDHFLRR